MEKVITKIIKKEGGISPSGKYYYYRYCTNSKWRVRIKIYSCPKDFSARKYSFEEIKECCDYEILSEKIVDVNF